MCSSANRAAVLCIDHLPDFGALASVKRRWIVPVLLIALWPVFVFSQDPIQPADDPGTVGAQNTGSATANSDEEQANTPGGFLGPRALFQYLRNGLRTVLEALHGLIGSWPGAIIFLGVLVRIAFLPLTVFNTRHQVSLNRTLTRLKPEMEALKEQFTDNAEARDEAILALQKKHGVSPVAQLQGCLPLMIQIPILIALFQELLSFEPIQGESFLWIDDLTKPDSLFVWGVDLRWFGDSFNLLPILLFGAHVLIARVASDHGLTKSMLGMPILIAMLFYPFPAGALLYWLTGSCVQVCEVALIRKGLTARPSV